MENSMNFMNETISSDGRISGTDVSPEESGWTMYFDDFFDQNSKNSFFSSGKENSLISDAVASAVKNKVADNKHEQVMGDRLSFKKRKTKVVVVDDELEDTASSRLTVPSLMSQYLDRKPKQLDINSQEKASSLSAQTDERNGVGSTNGRENNETELKKGGL